MQNQPPPGLPPRERSDAARNRSLLLVAAVSMDDVAAAAGVGKGTLYRRFGDKSGLVMAVLEAKDRALREAVVSGPPPLGPGAGPKTRLRAFVAAYAAYLERNLDLVVMGETASPGARYRGDAYAGLRHHIEGLLELAGTPSPEVSAELILTMLDGDLYAHLRTGRGWTEEAIAASMVAGADAIARRRH